MKELIIYMLICSFTPGPGNILALKTTTMHGMKKSILLILGICTGYAIVQTLCTVFLYQLNHLNASLLRMISLLGACYMIYLAYHMIQAKMNLEMEEMKPAFLEGMMLQLVNVEIYFYIMSLLSMYFIPMSTSVFDLVKYGIFAVSIGCSATLSWALAGSMIQKYYLRYKSLVSS